MPRLEAALQDLSSETKDLAKHLNTLYEHNLLCRPDPVQFILIGDTSHSQSTVLAALLDLRLPLKEHEASTPQMVTEYALYPKLLASERDFSLVSEEASSTERLNDSSTDQTALSATILDPLLHARHRTFRLSAEDIVGMTFVYLPRREQVEDHSQQLMTSIISKPNTVLLPILSAQQPVEKSEAVRIARKFDPKSERTLGIITRLDLISPADHTDYFSFMAQDPRERTLGWHVLYNNPIARSNDYDTERESDEELYFKNKFSSSHVLPKDQGIAALRKKLSKIALDHLREFSLPSITRNIREMISEKEGRLYQLGVRKTSVDEMRKYLHEVVDRTRNLTTAALNGDYSDRFFTAPARDKLPPLPDHSNIKRLRSTVCDLNDLFLHMMSTKGAPRRFLSHPAPDGKPFEEHPLPAHLSALLQLYSIPSPCVLLLENFVLEASERQTRSRLSNHALAVELFREQIARWEDVGRTHLRNIFHLAKNFTETLLAHIVGDEGSIYRRLLVDFVNPFYNAKWNELVQKLVELLRHYQEGFIQPLYDASSPVGINRENGAGSLSIWNKSGPGVDRPEVERVVRSVIQYYQVSH